MKVSELAKEYGLKSEDVLAELKALKLKSKDAKQDLSPAAIAVLRRSLESKGKKIVPIVKEEKPLPPKAPKEPEKKTEVKPAQKTETPSKAKKVPALKEKPKAAKKTAVPKVPAKGKKEKPQAVKAEKGKGAVHGSAKP